MMFRGDKRKTGSAPQAKRLRAGLTPGLLIVLLLTLFIPLSLLAGCGGSSGSNTNSPFANLQFDILWPPPATLSKAAAVPTPLNSPAAARSVAITFIGTTASSSFTEIIDRPAATAFTSATVGVTTHYKSRNQIDLSAATGSPLGFRVGTATLNLKFYSGVQGTGKEVGEVLNVGGKDGITIKAGDGHAFLSDGKTPVTFSVTGKIKSIAINDGQSVPVGIRKDVTVIAHGVDTNNNNADVIIALPLDAVKLAPVPPSSSYPGSITTAVAKVRGSGDDRWTITGATPGLAAITATLVDLNNTPPLTALGNITVYPQIQVAASGDPSNLVLGGSRQFSASVTYAGGGALDPSDTAAVRWRVQSIKSVKDNSSPSATDTASISSALGASTGIFDTQQLLGKLTVPPSGYTVTLEAVSELEYNNVDDANALSDNFRPASATKSDTKSFTLLPSIQVNQDSVKVDPVTGKVTVDPITKNLLTTIPASALTIPSTATLTVKTNDSSLVLWSVLEAGGGTIVPDSTTLSAVYTAPTQGGTFHVRAASSLDPTKYTDFTITVQAQPVAVTVN